MSSSRKLSSQDAEALRSHLNLHHPGRANGIAARFLARRMALKTRQVRKLITDLRMAGVPVCGHPRTGYFMAETPEELEATCEFLRSRAMHSLVLEAALRKISLPQLLGQVEMELEESA